MPAKSTVPARNYTFNFGSCCIFFAASLSLTLPFPLILPGGKIELLNEDERWARERWRDILSVESVRTGEPPSPFPHPYSIPPMNSFQIPLYRCTPQLLLSIPEMIYLLAILPFCVRITKGLRLLPPRHTAPCRSQINYHLSWFYYGPEYSSLPYLYLCGKSLVVGYTFHQNQLQTIHSLQNHYDLKC